MVVELNAGFEAIARLGAKGRMIVRTTGMKLWLVMGAMATMGSCMEERVVTHDPKYATDYVEGRIYRLKQDAFATMVNIKGHEAFDAHWRIEKPSPLYPTAGQYRQNPPRYMLEGIQLVPAGVRIEFRFIASVKNLETDRVHAYGRVMDGELIDQMVRISGISVYPGQGQAPQVDGEFLEVVGNGTGPSEARR
jgi:hypothetical protein